MNNRIIIGRDSGVVLVTALLYLLVLTLMVSSLFKVSVSQFRMSEHFQNTEMAFQQTESALAKAQSEIDQSRTKGQGRLNDSASYQFERVSTHCGFWLYRANATGKYQKAVKKLESIVLLPVPNEQCPEVIEKKRRMYWRER
jgi:hypothetical protein